MKSRLIAVAAILLLSSARVLAQQGAADASSNVSFWVAHWAKPRVILFGPEEDAFYQNMKDVMFLRNDYDAPINPSALDDNVQWLKDHPGVRFNVYGYASITGDIVYNLVLSHRRAVWVKQTLVSRGIPGDRIVVAAGWGELYPVCAEDTQECRDRNKLVRLFYLPK
jgi:outer membrane protein OmpA-like peptidoglycan-associated protein